MTTSTRYIGNCQICEGDQKLHNGRMVHHGYQRPGHGTIVGDCPGVGGVPYEVSCDLVKSYKRGVKIQLLILKDRLADLKEGRVSYLTQVERHGSWGTIGQNVVIEFIAGVTEPYRWQRALESATWGVESNVRHCEREIERCERRIAAWKPLPIRTVEEEQVKADGEKAARKAVRDAARAARAAKYAASKAKQEALEAKRAAIRKDFEDKFRALAAGSETLAYRQFEARKLLAELAKKKYRWTSKWELHCEEAFIALELAKQDGVAGHGRPYLRWF